MVEHVQAGLVPRLVPARPRGAHVRPGHDTVHDDSHVRGEDPSGKIRGAAAVVLPSY